MAESPPRHGMILKSCKSRYGNSLKSCKSHIVDSLKSCILTEIQGKATVSLNEMLARPDVPYGYKFVDGNVGVSGKKITLPHYMAMFL